MLIETRQFAPSSLLNVMANPNGESTYFYWSGEVHSWIKDQRPTFMFNIEGMSARRRILTEDGVFLAAREILLYRDKDGSLLTQYQNPLSGELNIAEPTLNDPVNIRFRIDKERMYFVSLDGTRNYGLIGQPERRGKFLTYDQRVFPFYDIEGWQKKYMSAELFNYVVAADQISLDNPDVTIVWSRLGPTVPWLNLKEDVNDIGLVYNASGYRIENWLDLPDTMRLEVEANHQKYIEAPTVVDPSLPNDTSFSKK